MAKHYKAGSAPKRDWYIQPWARTYGESHAGDLDAYVVFGPEMPRTRRAMRAKGVGTGKRHSYTPRPSQPRN